jgi:1,4-alpha-glucan branching enzyme
MQENIEELVTVGLFSNPHAILGLKKGGDQKQRIRLWRPNKEKCPLEVCGKRVEAKKIHESGLFELEVPSDVRYGDFRVFHPNGQWGYDPYSFDQVVGELDIHLLLKGLHYELYDLLGATCKTHQEVQGINFAVWAPNAQSVRLIGDFNGWQGDLNPMRRIGSTGVWELFIPGLKEGEKYKFEVVTQDGKHLIKSDPVGHGTEVRPRNASIVYDLNQFAWTDGDWLEHRGIYREGRAPINVYELHLPSWQHEEGHFISYHELAKRLSDYCKKMHYTHIELIGISEHPLDESWGYQVSGYFAPTSRHGTPKDFQAFVNHMHTEGIGVLIDWVPAHFPTDPHSLCRFDGTYLYEHRDPRQGWHPQWDTHIFNYGRWEVSNFLIASALFWFEKMHVDGLRVDAVSSMIYLDYGRQDGEWIPNRHGTNINLEAIEFMKHLNSIVDKLHPDVLMIAEESTAFPGITKSVEQQGLGFDLKWGLGWMNDTLDFFQKPFAERGENLSRLAYMLAFAFNEKFQLVLSHDEVVHEKKSLLSKMPGNAWEKFADLRLLLSFMTCFPGKKLLFMGGEFGQPSEWNCKESLPWHLLEEPFHQKLHLMSAALNAFYVNNKALYEKDQERESFEWVIVDDQATVTLAYLRKGASQELLCIHHFYPDPIEKYHLPVKGIKNAREVFNTDRAEWGGSGILNNHLDFSPEGITISLPPLATVILEIDRDE